MQETLVLFYFGELLIKRILEIKHQVNLKVYPISKMKTDNQYEQAILDILNKIRVDFPELVKYINEMPLRTNDSNEKGIQKEELETYFNSLTELYIDYSGSHTVVKGD
jgi:hypothetical protein